MYPVDLLKVRDGHARQDRAVRAKEKSRPGCKSSIPQRVVFTQAYRMPFPRYTG
jgi:hypothetical protein